MKNFIVGLVGIIFSPLLLVVGIFGLVCIFGEQVIEIIEYNRDKK